MCVAAAERLKRLLHSHDGHDGAGRCVTASFDIEGPQQALSRWRASGRLSRAHTDPSGANAGRWHSTHRVNPPVCHGRCGAWRSMRAVEELFRQWRADLTSDPMEWVCEISRIGLRHGYGVDMHGYGRVEMGAAALRLARHHHYHQHHISTTLISTPASRHPPRLHDLARCSVRLECCGVICGAQPRHRPRPPSGNRQGNGGLIRKH